MKTYIYLILFLSIICKDLRRPTKATVKCLKQKLGKEKVKSLIESFRKYHRNHGKANFTEFINDKKSELKETLEKCLLVNNRRLDDEKVMETTLKELKSLLKHNVLAKQIRTFVKNGNLKKAVQKCNTIIKEKLTCQRFVKKMAKKIKQFEKKLVRKLVSKKKIKKLVQKKKDKKLVQKKKDKNSV